MTLLTLGLAACGGGSDNSTSTGSTAAKPTEGGSTKESGSQIRHLGHEATAKQAKQAEAALRGYLDARAAGEWKVACSDLSEAVKRSMTRSGGSCARSVRISTERLPAAKRSGLAKIDVTEVRVKQGRSGFVFYYDADGAERAMAMDLENGTWKVVSRVPLIPKSQSRREGSGV